MRKFEPFALRFDTEREAEMVAEALDQLHADNPTDTLALAKMRRLMAEALGYAPPDQ